MNRFWQALKPYWDISFQCSRAYALTTLVVLLLYFIGYVTLFHSIFQSQNNYFFISIVMRTALESILFLGSAHFILRPYLRLNLIPQGRLGWNLIGLTIGLYILGLLEVLTSTQFSKLIPFLIQFDLNSISLSAPSDPGKSVTMKMDRPNLILLAAFNQTILYGIWALVYFLWQTLISKKQIQQQMQEAQMRQLTNQLNPHFLFNSLNSIRALIFEDQGKAAHTLTQLSELFRVHLQANLKPTSSLQDEWQIAKRYLEIEQVRLEDRLKLSLQFDDSLWQNELPTLTLLTLVENAVKHGISPNNQGGTISISSEKSAHGFWKLCVKNTVINNSLEKCTHIGIANLEQRLQLLSPRHKLYYRRLPDHFELTMDLFNDKNTHCG